jgi:DNA polymerase-3 subunit epsilon
MKLELSKPLVVFDVETTGTDPVRDRIVEIALVRLHPDGRRERFVCRVNPGIPIPPESTAIHGISDADVAASPKFDAVAPEIVAFIADSDLGGYNVVKFDIPVLQAELRRVGRSLPVQGRAIVDPQKIFFLKEPRDLSAACRLYCGRELEGAHGALADAEATVDVLLGQVDRYDDLPKSVDGLSALLAEGQIDPEGRFRWKDGDVVIAFGKHRGQSLRELSDKKPEYLRWMVGADFSEEVKKIAREALAGNYPPPPGD